MKTPRLTATQLVAKIKGGGPLTRRDLRAIEAFNRSAYARAALVRLAADAAGGQGEGPA